MLFSCVQDSKKALAGRHAQLQHLETSKLCAPFATATACCYFVFAILVNKSKVKVSWCTITAYSFKKC